LFLSAAKQEAFEENLRLKNQFRSLDDDEVDFLDSVLESTREKEQQVKRETAEQLEAFRKQREAAEKQLSESRAVADTSSQPDSLAQEESWATSSRKRRRAKEKNDNEVVKLRKNSSTIADASPTKLSEDSPKAHKSTSGGGDFHSASSDHYRDCSGTANTKPIDVNPPRKAVPPPQNIPSALGLVLYSSDEDW
jgi:FAM192A/Fyv6, N-terminal domain